MTEIRTYTVPSDGAGNTISVASGAGSPMGLLLLLTYAAGAVTVTGTPDYRTYVIGAESRTYAIPAEDRTLIVNSST